MTGSKPGAEVNVQADWNITNTDSDAYIHNKPTIPAAQVQADWNESTNTEVDYIKNKPTQLSDFDAPAYANNDGRALGLVSSGSLSVDRFGKSAGSPSAPTSRRIPGMATTSFSPAMC